MYINTVHSVYCGLSAAPVLGKRPGYTFLKNFMEGALLCRYCVSQYRGKIARNIVKIRNKILGES
jgi:hypothetical protein